MGQRLDNYRLVRLVGAGAFGEVYLGEQVYKRTQVAVKVLPPLSNDDLPNFLNEARTIRLKHPHIVHILDFGLDGRTPFLVMDLAPHGSLLQRHPRGTRLPLETIVVYVKQIADALQYAHNERLIHRDIKPENLLVGANYEVLVSDFGIATMARSTRSLDTHNIAGTVAYMAPEQLQGKPCIASDQYALGVVVYEWLSGERPFKGSPIEIATQHLFASPPPLREKLPMISLDTEKVVMKALSKDPHNRFASVQEFAYALEQTATPPTGAVICTYCGHSESVISLAWSPNSRYIVSYVEDRVHVWEATTGHKTFTFEREPLASLLGPGSLVACSPNGESIAFYAEKTVRIWDLDEGRQTFAYSEQSEKVDSVVWLADGFHALSKIEDGYGKKIKFWNLLGDQSIVCHAFREIYDPICSPDGKFIAGNLISYSGNEDDGYEPVNGGVIVWSATTGNEVLYYWCSDNSGGNNILTWSPDSRYIASADGDFQVWDVISKRQVIAKDVTMNIDAISWAPNGKYIAYVDGEGDIQIWDITAGSTIFTYRGHMYKNNKGGYTLSADNVAWSPDSRRIASTGYTDNTVHVWDATTGDNAVICRDHPFSKQARPFNHLVEWSPDCNFIVTATRNGDESKDCTVHVWDALTGNISYTFREQSGKGDVLTWSRDGKYIASAGDDKTVRVWVAPLFT